jgi:HK97 family phage prohead protease
MTPFTDTFRRPSVARPSKDAALDLKRSAVVELEDKALVESPDYWTVTGYAAAFNNRDRGGDVILPGAFAKSLKENGLPILLFQHKMDEAPVGAIVEAKEDKRGLWIRAELPRDDDFVRGRLIPQLKRRGLKGMSIGYKITPGGSSVRREDGARLLKEITLFECSFVSLPMNPAAGVESVSKAVGDGADVIDAILALRAVFEALTAEAVKMDAEAATINTALKAANGATQMRMAQAAADAAMATRTRSSTIVSGARYDFCDFMREMAEISAAARSLRGNRW